MLQPQILGIGLSGVGMPFAEINLELATGLVIRMTTNIQSTTYTEYIQHRSNISELLKSMLYANSHNTLIVHILFFAFISRSMLVSRMTSLSIYAICTPYCICILTHEL